MQLAKRQIKLRVRVVARTGLRIAKWVDVHEERAAGYGYAK
jgi:hypothetical protein